MRLFICPFGACNPLKRLISDERIQGNPSFSKFANQRVSGFHEHSSPARKEIQIRMKAHRQPFRAARLYTRVISAVA
jgi:hypothetical protein